VRKLGLSSRIAKVQVLSFASVFFAPAKKMKSPSAKHDIYYQNEREKTTAL